MKAIKASLCTALIVFSFCAVLYGVAFYPNFTALAVLAALASAMIAIIWCVFYVAMKALNAEKS